MCAAAFLTLGSVLCRFVRFSPWSGRRGGCLVGVDFLAWIAQPRRGMARPNPPWSHTGTGERPSRACHATPRDSSYATQQARLHLPPEHGSVSTAESDSDAAHHSLSGTRTSPNPCGFVQVSQLENSVASNFRSVSSIRGASTAPTPVHLLPKTATLAQACGSTRLILKGHTGPVTAVRRSIFIFVPPHGVCCHPGEHDRVQRVGAWLMPRSHALHSPRQLPQVCMTPRPRQQAP